MVNYDVALEEELKQRRIAALGEVEDKGKGERGRKGRPKPDIAECNDELKKDPTNIRALLLRGQAYARKGQVLS